MQNPSVSVSPFFFFCSNFIRLIMEERLYVLEMHGYMQRWKHTWRWEPTKKEPIRPRKLMSCSKIGNNRGRGCNNKLYKLIWNNEAATKIKMLAWRAVKGRIATFWELQKRGSLPASASTLCAICNKAEESMTHMFCECESVQQLWAECIQWIEVQAPLVQAIFEVQD